MIVNTISKLIGIGKVAFKITGLSILIFTSLSNYSIAQQTQPVTRAKLDVNNFKYRIQVRSNIAAQDSNIEIRGVFDDVSKALEYEEFNRRTGERLSVSGNSKIGYDQYISNCNVPAVEHRTFYSNGEVKSIDTFYSEEYLKQSPKVLKYPIAKGYFYSKTGEIFVTDYDTLITYKIDYIYKFLEKKKAVLANADLQIEASPYNDSVLWEVRFYSKKFGRCFFQIDAKDGKILVERTHYATYE